MTPHRIYLGNDSSLTADFGWTPNPDGVERFLSSLPKPTFAQAAPDLVEEDRDALLWEACIKVTGSNIPAHNQQSVGCHSADTEVLTRDGWVLWPEYDGRNLLATVHPQTQKLEFQEPLFNIAYEYQGPLYRINHQSLSFGLTPNHRMLIRPWNQQQKVLGDHFVFRTVEELGWYSGLPLAPAGTDQPEIRTFDAWGHSFSGDDFTALIALVLSDGWVGGTENTKNRISFCCFREDRYGKVAALAQRLAFTEQENRKGVWTRSIPALAAWMRDSLFTGTIYRSPFKRIPEFVRILSQRQIGLFLDFFGDQHVRNGRRQFYSSSRRLIDDLQELLLRIGKHGSIYSRPQRTARTSDGRIISKDGVGDDITLTEWTGNQLSIHRKKQLYSEPYQGTVYCATVPNGTLVTRHQGNVLISGNCCVGEGWSSGMEYATCVEIALGGPLEYKHVSHSAIYALSREVGNMLGRGDGSYGAAAAEAAQKHGTCSCEEAGESNENSGKAKEWGRTGVPSNVRELCKPHISQVALVSSAQEAKIALQNGYPIPVCSNQGFSMQRNEDGFCRAQGSWAHCMLIIGYRRDKDWFCILQSWGPNTPSGPVVLGQPDCSFFTDSNTVDRMLRQRDSFAISAYEGYKQRNLNWLI